ncbi:hypothetical protein FOCC_FOCC013315, partial [Frankliniella occidentalis]
MVPGRQRAHQLVHAHPHRLLLPDAARLLRRLHLPVPLHGALAWNRDARFQGPLPRLGGQPQRADRRARGLRQGRAEVHDVQREVRRRGDSRGRHGARPEEDPLGQRAAGLLHHARVDHRQRRGLVAVEDAQPPRPGDLLLQQHPAGGQGRLPGQRRVRRPHLLHEGAGLLAQGVPPPHHSTYESHGSTRLWFGPKVLGRV